MLFSIRGKVIQIEQKFLVVEANSIGYEILVSNSEKYKLNEEVFLYLHHEIKEDNEYLVGFNDLPEKNAFNLLLHVSGIGPKSALTILSKVNPDELLTAISNDDFEFINSIPGISARIASQMLLDLKDYITKSNRENFSRFKDIKSILKSFKFKSKEIDDVLLNIYIPNATDQDILKEALKRLGYGKNFG